MSEETDFLTEQFILDGEGEPESKEVTCNRCGKTGLEWMHNGVGWRLLDETGLHRCKARDLQRAALGDFDVIS